MPSRMAYCGLPPTNAKIEVLFGIPSKLLVLKNTVGFDHPRAVFPWNHYGGAAEALKALKEHIVPTPAPELGFPIASIPALLLAPSAPAPFAPLHHIRRCIHA